MSEERVVFFFKRSLVWGEKAKVNFKKVDTELRDWSGTIEWFKNWSYKMKKKNGKRTQAKRKWGKGNVKRRAAKVCSIKYVTNEERWKYVNNGSSNKIVLLCTVLVISAERLQSSAIIPIHTVLLDHQIWPLFFFSFFFFFNILIWLRRFDFLFFFIFQIRI